MAKQHSMTKGGILASGLLLATALQAKDTFVANVQSLGDVTVEVICTAQKVTGGMVSVANCDDASTAPASPADSVDGD